LAGGASLSKVTVVGGGVSGLTTSIRLAEAGHDVQIVARDYLVGTTSWVATAIWHLFWVKIDERVERWSASSLAELLRLAEDSSTGVTRIRGIECVRAGTPEEAEFRAGTTGALWKQIVPSYQPLTRSELIARLPHGYDVDTLLGGYVIEVPIADMSVYLPYLMRRLDRLAVPRRTGSIGDFDEVRTNFPADWYVNCTGLGARELASDSQLRGIKGQIVRIARGGVKEYIADDFSPTGMTYILPRGNDIVLGGSEDDGREDNDIDPELAREILQRCAQLVPEVADLEVLEHMAGVRPYRVAIRLEVDPDNHDMVHNYGHGGSGVSLSWGCADEVVNLITHAEAVV
jgi:D-amino-acid oxidase